MTGARAHKNKMYSKMKCIQLQKKYMNPLLWITYIFRSLLNTVYILNVQVEKVCEPSNLISVWPCFGSNNLQQMCPVIVDQTHTTVRRDFAPFSSAIFLWCLMWIALLRSCQSFSLRLRSGLWHGHSRRRIFFRWSRFLLLCFGSLSCCITQPQLSFRWQTDLTFSFNESLWPLQHTLELTWGCDVGNS